MTIDDDDDNDNDDDDDDSIEHWYSLASLRINITSREDGSKFHPGIIPLSKLSIMHKKVFPCGILQAIIYRN